MAKKQKPERQNWKPNWLLRIVQFLWTAALSAVKIAIGGAATVLFIGIICGFVLIGAAGEYLQEDVIPEISFSLDNYGLDQTSFIYYVDNNGKIRQMQKIYTDTDRQWADLDDIPEDLIHATVAIEDKRFYEHQGVDWITTIKACARMFFGDDSVGGSTITQQLIKNRTQDNSVTVQRKVQEIFKAQIVEMSCDKDVIMEQYLNTIYMGHGCYGVKSAAYEYFGKDLAELTTAECASLIAITNNPSLFDPYIRPENNRERQLTTLEQMLDQEWITQEEYDEAVAQEMVFTSQTDDVFTYACTGCDFIGSADSYVKDENGSFFCPICNNDMTGKLESSTDMYSWYTELVIEDVAKVLAEKQGMIWNDATEELCTNMVRKGGYHIYSSIDMDVQDIVDEVYTNLENVPKTDSNQQLLSAIVVIDNRTGDVAALAGSVGEKTDFDAFSYATDGGLQTGSSMKPLAVYAPAFELGVISPSTVIADAPLYSGFPLNDSRTYSGSMTVLAGVSRSVNTISVNVLDQIGLSYSFEFAKNKFGLEGLLEEEVEADGTVRSDIAYAPLGLGALTYGVTVRDMASAYATFPNDGVIREDRTFTKVYDSEGNLVIDNTQDSERILSKKAANYMNYCLRNVVTSGTGTSAALSTTAVAGKTGTTSDDRDRWFVGYTKYYTAAVWCGFENPEEIDLVGNWTNPALRMWKQVMEPLHENVEWLDIYSDEDMYWTAVCLDTGRAATDACRADPRGSRSYSALVSSGDGAGRSCDRHTTVDWCSTGDGAANEYCRQAEGNTIVSHALLKCTSSEISGRYRYSNLTDDCVYLIDSSGNPANFYGIGGNINKGVSAPYKVCTKHTASSVKPPEPDPTEPTTQTAP